MVIKLDDLFESHMILMKVGNKRTIHKKIRAIEQILGLDPVKIIQSSLSKLAIQRSIGRTEQNKIFRLQAFSIFLVCSKYFVCDCTKGVRKVITYN